MSKLLDQLLIVDVEATCWPKEPPNGEKSEIIEIGIATVNLASLDMEVDQTRTILIKPTVSSVSKYCTDLTTLTAEILEQQGIAFEEALSILKSEFKSNLRTWASWGDYDRNMFDKQCRGRGLKYPFGPTHLNLKNLFALVSRTKKELCVHDALEMLGLTFQGVPHRGGDDAYNIAVMATKILA